MSDYNTLRGKARQAMQAGKLPNRPPDRTWGGPGVGARCPICSAPVTRDDVELEIEFARGDEGSERDDGFHVHIRCFAAWEFELGQAQSAPTTASIAGRPSESYPDTAGNRRELSGTANAGKIASRGCAKNYKRGPA